MVVQPPHVKPDNILIQIVFIGSETISLGLKCPFLSYDIPYKNPVMNNDVGEPNFFHTFSIILNVFTIIINYINENTN